ncbi:L-2-hydroxyglutarate oxidase LhgO [Paracidovorax konjaci]|uniref:L-2-hydroxyglutarate oxidase LhgO n=2 Tax=Paracidovorax konjaci TaxID=32040 RepID=A0A1I1ZBE0_9BURK|nr:L-2-hydroxyglutarate oxidase LhgO [Paracidovorax konjaci]
MEATNAVGSGTSSRNSEVIHAGLYYPEGSLKARLCVQGKHMLYAYCAQRAIPHRRCGKLIVATLPEQLAALDMIVARARANGVVDLQRLTRQEAQELEPAVECAAALLSPSTGIVDSHAFMFALQGDLENAGGIVVLNAPFAKATCVPGSILLEAVDGTQLKALCVVNAAGLRAPDMARRFQGAAVTSLPQPHYAKGSYFSLTGKAPFSRLIYPVPEEGGLGVHLTLDLGGQAKFGPDVEWVPDPEDLAVDPARGLGFYAEVRKYWPGLRDGTLQPAYAGMRPKIHGPREPAADFTILGPETHGVPGQVHLLGIESPGLTSALAIAEHVESLLTV